MPGRARPIYRAAFFLVLAPVAAAVIVSVLLLFGLNPHAVFAPGFAVKSLLQRWGIHAPNAVGVISTVALWWAIVATIGIAWERRSSRAPRS